MRLDELTTEEAYHYINHQILPMVHELFVEKQSGYVAGPFLQFGSRGEVAEIGRKFWKLHGSIWEGNELVGEQPMEIAMDLYGHVLLLLFTLLREKEILTP